ncbi:3-ketoacyl-CoA synthase [Quillaja saponaria]|uniref:3-ketoacyl-CoA synthase n=1 Tax=Quillaja saponaria TaxID=32244 RepID=A0AAD7M6W2_QUISA|nr:3-ketoacyl-CoA synthase [Quillaja saponaria]
MVKSLRHILSFLAAFLSFLLLFLHSSTIFVSFPIFSLISFLYYLFITIPSPIYLLNYSCFKPNPTLKCTYNISKNFIHQSNHFTQQSQDFMSKIFLNSGLGEETYAPEFIFQSITNHEPNLQSAIHEAQEGMFSSIDSLLLKTRIDPSCIDIVIVTSGCFSPSPSLSSFIVNHYKLRPDVKTYNLSSMGCSAGVISIDLAAKLLKRRIFDNVKYALVVVTENISSNWYIGDNRPMLVTNCLFRVGCASALITNDPNCRRVAKMELVDSLRTHHGADNRSYQAAFQEEDDKGITGISLSKDLVHVAGGNLREHMRILGPRVLPLSQLVLYAYSMVVSTLWRGGDSKPVVPDFKTAFKHFCIHTGGKKVIEQVDRVLRLGEEVTEPARMSLHRFGNTSSSLVFYELAYFEAKGRVRRGDRMWMLGFGTGFKVGSLVWKSLSDITIESDNPWKDCIHKYPL